MVDRNRLIRIVVPAVLVGVAGVLLFARLDQPGRILFDETYYVPDARQYLDQGVEEGFAVHPPVGKWMIAASIAVLGDNPWGWRAVGAAVGALSVLFTYFIGLRLFRRVGPAAVAGLLLATDGLWIVQARTSMLDIHLAFFVVLGAWLLLVDRDRSGLSRGPPAVPVAADPPPDAPADDPVAHDPVADDPVADDPVAHDAVAHDAGAHDAVAHDAAAHEEHPRPVLPRRGHPYRALAGVAFGLAVATKWSGLLPLAAAGVVALGWELAWRRRWTGRFFAGWPRGAASLLAGLVLIPTAVYTASWIPWLVNIADSHEGARVCGEGDDGDVNEPCPAGPVDRVAGLARFHGAVWEFHTSLEATHTYRAQAYTWPIMARPIVFYYESCSGARAAGTPTENDEGELEDPEPCVVDEGEASEIIALGNPALWWTFAGAAAFLGAAIPRRDGRGLFVLAFWSLQFLPWLIVSRPVFFFYMVPVVPFLALGIGYVVTILDERRPLLGTLGGGALGGLAGFLLGLGFEAAVAAETTTARWLALGTGWVLGAALGTWRDRNRDPAPVARRWRPGTALAGVVGLAAVALLVYFLPVWTGETLPADSVRQRWWFDGWI